MSPYRGAFGPACEHGSFQLQNAPAVRAVPRPTPALGHDGEPPYRVRYEDGHETEIFPGAGCVTETRPASGSPAWQPHRERR
ncbi:DUF1918 domain-containing protein [Streptomyces sp. HUAS TT3]|uniref:DUF1918 domain-containing protein n=1 Tax=Streptomyces sp. HUAS TT3 TaxID=3447510 RepID=UPI003F65D811